MAIIIIVLMFVALALAARKWGFNSRDGIQSSEWGRRANRTGSIIY